MCVYDFLEPVKVDFDPTNVNVAVGHGACAHSPKIIEKCNRKSHRNIQSPNSDNLLPDIIFTIWLSMGFGSGDGLHGIRATDHQQRETGYSTILSELG